MEKSLSKLNMVMMYALINDCDCEVCKAIRKVYKEVIKESIKELVEGG